MQDLSPNDATLRIYNQKFEEYLKHTPSTYSQGHKPLLRWIDFSLELVPRNGEILEIGSGHGRDARYINKKGFSILCSDGAPAFVKYLNARGQKAIDFNALKDELNSEYNLIFANAVIPHFTPDDLILVLKKVHDMLLPGGIFAFNAKQGFGEDWINEKFIEKRYVHYWLPEKLRRLVENSNYEICFMEYDIPGGDLPTHTWIHITARKK